MTMLLQHMRCRRRVSRLLTAVLMVALGITGCDISSMAFVRDERVRIVQPEDRSTVQIPVTLRWELDGFTVTGRDGRTAPDAGYFAVFVDRPPIPPGKTLEWFARQADSCGAGPCGTVDRLAHVYATRNTELQIDLLPTVETRGLLERHEAVIILLDGTGTRIGESAFYVRFEFDRRPSL